MNTIITEKTPYTLQHAKRAISKIKINFGLQNKNSSFLGKSASTPLSRQTTPKVALDLDTSCFLFDHNGAHLDTVNFTKSKSKCHAIQLEHYASGDIQAALHIDFEKLPHSIAHIALVLHSFSGRSFNQVNQILSRILLPSGQEVYRYKTEGKGNHKSMYIGLLSNRNIDSETSCWDFRPKTDKNNCFNIQQLLPILRESLAEV